MKTSCVPVISIHSYRFRFTSPKPYDALVIRKRCEEENGVVKSVTGIRAASVGALNLSFTADPLGVWSFTGGNLRMTDNSPDVSSQVRSGLVC